MTTPPEGIYERFRRGLLEYHSENEREYIESMRETKCLQVYKSHVAEGEHKLDTTMSMLIRYSSLEGYFCCPSTCQPPYFRFLVDLPRNQD